MKSRKNGHIIEFVLAAGEELVQEVHKILEEHKIQSARIQGIGGAKQCRLGFYNPTQKAYEFRNFDGPFEITSLLGNATMIDGKPFPHLHINLGDSNFKTIGGHAAEVIIYPTFEGFIEALPKPSTRHFDKGTQLNLIEV